MWVETREENLFLWLLNIIEGVIQPGVHGSVFVIINASLQFGANYSYYMKKQDNLEMESGAENHSP